jgi:hypothetical protein
MSIGQADERAGGDQPTKRGPGESGPDGGRQRDEAFVTLMRSGDETAFGLLFDAWADPVYDRISNRGFTTADASQIESGAFSTVHDRLSNKASDGSFRVMAMRASRQEMTSAEAHRVDTSLPVGPYAEDRLTRGTEVKSLATDPAVAALLWEAVDVLGDQVREVLDLHYRHRFTVAEVAEVLQQPPAAMEDILRKVPAGYSAVVRAKIIWRQGQPNHSELAAAVAGQSRFDASMVRRVAEHLRTCEDCRVASQVQVAPIDVFAAIPIAIAPAGFKESVVESLDGEGVSMRGSVSAPRPVVEPEPEPEPEPRSEPEHDHPGAGFAAIPIIGATTAAAGAAGATIPSAPSEPDELVSPSAYNGSGGSAPAENRRQHEHLASENRYSSPLDTPFVPRTDGDGDDVGESAAAAGLAAFVGSSATATAAPSESSAGSLADQIDLGGPASSSGGSSGAGAKRWALIGVACLAVVALLAFFLTQGSSKKSDKLATAQSGEQTTTTTAVASGTPTTAAVTPSTVAGGQPAPTTSVTTGGPATTVKPGQPTQTTVVQGTTPTTSALFPGLKRLFSITGANPINTPAGSWDTSAPGAPNLQWSVSANDPVTVVVSGPGFSSTQMSGSSAALCPGTISGTTCTVAPGNYAYTLTVTDTHGHSLPETIVLTVVHN